MSGERTKARKALDRSVKQILMVDLQAAYLFLQGKHRAAFLLVNSICSFCGKCFVGLKQ